MIITKNKWFFSVLLLIASNLKEVHLEKVDECHVCNTPLCQQAAQNLKDSMNPLVNPCENFYEFACGNWGKKYPTKTLFVSSSTLTNRADANTKEIIEFLRKNNSDEEPKAVHKSRQLFSSCTDTATLDKDGITPLFDILNRIGLNLNSSNELDLTYTLVRAWRILGKEIFFMASVTPNPFDRAINLIGIQQPTDENTALMPALASQQKNQYESIGIRDYMKLTFNVLCEYLSTAKCQQIKDKLNSYDAMTELVSYSNKFDEIRTRSYPNNSNLPQLITLKQLQNITDKVALELNATTLDWTRIIKLTFENTTAIDWTTFNPENFTIVAEITYINDILKFIFSNSLKQHEIGLTWKMIDKLALYSEFQIRDLKKNYSSNLNYETRDQWCAHTVSQIMGKAVSYYYATNKTYEFIRKEMKILVNHIHQAFRNIIQSAAWMDNVTKAKAVNKTNSMKSYVSFPDSLREKKEIDDFYSDFEITNSFFETVVKNTGKAVNEKLNSLNSKNDLDTDRENLTPVMVNAFYDPEQNAIVIPAGILGFPLCGNDLQSLNFGAIGSIIGHEITHGFDDKGRLYNYLGNSENWWDEKSLNEFKRRTQCFKKTYKQYWFEKDGVNFTTDSIATLSENLADSGGFRSALTAYRQYLSKYDEPLLTKFENYTKEQLFTISFAQVWCEHQTQNTVVLSSKVHSPNIIRVNGIAMNSQEFPQIWHCPKGSAMNPSVEKCKLW